jgi:hypothetical protein
MFDPRSPYHRRMWHYESDRPLSVAQLVSLGSLDARTAALLWLLIERHRSVIVSGPTDPTPGIGKTTTLNALLGFLPVGSTLVYTTGMYEEFDFIEAVQPATTCVLANEVSDHLYIYMWDDVARRLLRMPQEGFAVATSCHADTIRDVLAMLTRDLKLAPADVSQLGIIINIGIVGRVWPPRRRFLTVYFAAPEGSADGAAVTVEPTPARRARASGQAGQSDGIRMLQLAAWDETTDTFLSATPETLADLAAALCMTSEELDAAITRREETMRTLASGRGVGMSAMREAVDALVNSERAGEGVAGAANTTDANDSDAG